MEVTTEFILNHIYLFGVLLSVLLISFRIPDWLWYRKFLSKPYRLFKKGYTRPTAGTSQLKYKHTDKSDSLLAFFRTYDTPSLGNVTFEINKKIQFMNGFKHLVNYVIGVALPLLALVLAGSDFIGELLKVDQKVLLIDGISFILIISVIVAFVDFAVEIMLKAPLKQCLLAIEDILKQR